MIANVLKNNAFLALQYAVGSLVPLVLVPHLVRTLGLESFGRIAVTIACASYGCLVVQYAFHYTGPHRVAQMSRKSDGGNVFSEISGAKVLLLLGALPLLPLVAWRSVAQEGGGAHLLILLALPVAAALNSSWYLQARGKFLWICLFAITGSLTALAVGFFCVVDGSERSLWWAAVSTVIGPAISGAATFAAGWRASGSFLSPPRLGGSLEVIREGWPLFASQLIASLYGLSGPIVIGYLSSAVDAGIYSAFDRILTAVVGACLLTHTAAYPRLTAAYGEDRRGYGRLIKFVLGSYFSLTAAIACAAWFFRAEVGRFIIGTQGEAHEGLLGLCLIRLILSILGTTLTAYLTVSCRSKEVIPLNLTVLAVSFGAGIPLVLSFGGAGWLAGLVVSQLVVLVAVLRNWREMTGGAYAGKERLLYE